MKQLLWFGLTILLLAGKPAVATVNSIVLGASASGTISGFAFGNYDLGGSSTLYGFGSVSVDENLLVSEYEEFYPDPLQEPVQPVVGSLKIGLDMSVDNSLRVIANSKVLDTSAITTVRNDQAGSVAFSISKNASVVATFSGTATASLTIRDNFSALVWSSGDGTDPFALTAGLYNIAYSLSSDFSPFIGYSPIEDFDLQLAFTPANDPPPPPGPIPPPGPEAVPEPVSMLVWGLGGIATIVARRRIQSPQRMGKTAFVQGRSL